jgi:hypothetical protein
MNFVMPVESVDARGSDPLAELREDGAARGQACRIQATLYHSVEIGAGIDDGESLFADTNRDNAAFRELVGGNEPKSRMA